MQAEDCIPLMLSSCPSHQPLGPWLDPQEVLRETEETWRAWSERCVPVGQLTEVVRQSLLVLKGLTFAPTGGIVAAPTTSLPEQPGGVRNWDYRYCWLRDARSHYLLLAALAMRTKRRLGATG